MNHISRTYRASERANPLQPAISQKTPVIKAASSPQAQPLDTFALRDMVLAQVPGARINWIPPQPEPGHSVRFHISAQPPLPYDEGSLTLGSAGILLLGIVSLAWTRDCFIG